VDVLSDILRTCRLHSSVFAFTELGAPWGMSTQGQPQSVFHVILRGNAWLDGEDIPATRLDAGDVVLVSPHRRHTLRDTLKTRAKSIEQLLAEGAFTPGRAPPPPTDRPTTQLVCGCFHVDETGAKTLLTILPPVIHLRDLPRVAPWLEHTIKLMTYESAADRPGSETVVNRLCDALFVYVVRDFIEASASGHASWLRGLSDPHVAAALQRIHERPEGDWSVATLASEVGLSRSGFAARFAELVGESPMRYITRWRLNKAVEMLRGGRSSIAEVAARVGYESAAAFHKAFKRTLGVSPGEMLRSESVV